LFLDGQVVAEIAAPFEQIRENFRDIPELESLDILPIDGDYFRVAMVPKNGFDLRPIVFELVRNQGWDLRELTRSRHSLEDIFVRLTQPQKEER
jgi:hypothetical protein